jgi:hypothetical protein
MWQFSQPDVVNDHSQMWMWSQTDVDLVSSVENILDHETKIKKIR